METLAAFPSYQELKLFKDWLDSPDLDTFRTVTGRKGHTVAGTGESPSEFSEIHSLPVARCYRIQTAEVPLYISSFLVHALPLQKSAA